MATGGNTTHLLSSIDAEVDALQDQVESLPVSDGVLPELHGALCGPRGVNLFLGVVPGSFLKNKEMTEWYVLPVADKTSRLPAESPRTP